MLFVISFDQAFRVAAFINRLAELFFEVFAIAQPWDHEYGGRAMIGYRNSPGFYGEPKPTCCYEPDEDDDPQNSIAEVAEPQ